MPLDPAKTQATAYLDRALGVRAKARAASLGRTLSCHLVVLLEADLATASLAGPPSAEPELVALLAELRALTLHLTTLSLHAE